MTPENLTQATPKNTHIHNTRQQHRTRHVVRRTRTMQLIQKPQPLLRKRQHQITTTWQCLWCPDVGGRGTQRGDQICPPVHDGCAYFFRNGPRRRRIPQPVSFQVQTHASTGQQF
nr:hypothetical protein [Streptomyces lunaelactis]